MDLQILIATENDLKAILDLQKRCYKTEAELYNQFDLPPLKQTTESIKEEMRNGTLFLKGVIDGHIVGSVRGNIQNNTAFIGRLIVKEELQNNKIGQTLMKEIELQLENCNRYELFTGFKSEKNIKLYQKLGYNKFKHQFINANLTLIYLEKLKLSAKFGSF